MPGAKPFPSQIRIGVDIAHVPRFKNLISRHIDGLRPSNAKDQHDPDGVKSWSLRRWGKRVISQLEWARFDFLVSQLEPATTTSEDKVHVDNVASWLAGRWAAKEAAIKAHHHRRLFMNQISILGRRPGHGPSMLIDPPFSIVCMSEEVARKRGIRTGYTEDFNRERVVELLRGTLGRETRGPSPLGKDVEAQLKGQVIFRHKSVRMEDRQLADLSISHDGDFAVAVVQALDEPLPNHSKPELVVDDGQGRPMHAQQVGDEGYKRLGKVVRFMRGTGRSEGQEGGEEQDAAEGAEAAEAVEGDDEGNPLPGDR